MYLNEYQSSMLAQGRIEQLMREATQHELVRQARQINKANKKLTKSQHIKNQVASITH